MSSILKITNFEQTNLSIAAPKALGNMGAKVVSLNYKFPEGQAPITLQTPWLRSYGINKWVDPDHDTLPPKLSVTVSFLGHETDPKITEFKEFLEALDEWAVDIAHKNSWEWLKSKSVPRDTVAFNYTRSLKVPVDKETGEPNGKPANMKLKLSHTDATGYSASFFTKEKTVLSTEEVESYFTMGSKVRGLIQCTGFWIAAGKFGLSWKLKQMVIEPSSKIGRDYAFDDEEAETTATGDESPKKVVAAVPKQPVLQVVDSEHDDDDAAAADAEELVAVVEPVVEAKKVIRRVIPKAK